VEGRLVLGVCHAGDGRRASVRLGSDTLGVAGGVGGAVREVVGGWAGGDGGGRPLRRIASAAAACVRLMRGGRAGHATSPFQTGDGAGVTGDVAPLHGASAAQGSVFPMTAAQRVQRRLFRPSSASAKTPTWADVDEARTGREVRWARLEWVRNEAQDENVIGLWPLLLHDVNVQEKGGAGAVVGVLVGCD